MGKARRNRARRQASRGPGGDRLISSMEDIDAAGEEFAVEMPCRITYLSDPALGGMRAAEGIAPDGSLTVDDSGTAEPLPVVLFEPARALMMQNTQTGLVQEARVEGVIAAGFHRVPGHSVPVWAFKPAPGWEVRRVPDGLVLRDGTGDVWARSQLTLDPAWVSAATSSRQVGVFYGPQLGVRVPPGMNPAAYTTAKRAAEFGKARGQGLVTAATVTWHGEAAAETLEWVIFQPGSFGQPFAGVFAPIANFTRHGGPEMFGLAQLRDQDMGISADPIRTLAARVSRTDVDLIDPAEDAVNGQVGGVHYSEGIHAAWRRAAARDGKVLLLTGSRLPGQPGAGPRQPDGDPGELWAALIPVHAA